MLEILLYHSAGTRISIILEQKCGDMDSLRHLCCGWCCGVSNSDVNQNTMRDTNSIKIKIGIPC